MRQEVIIDLPRVSQDRSKTQSSQINQHLINPYIFGGIAIGIILVISNMIIIIALFILIMNPPHLR